ncbi:MAG: aspartate aminotransferase family protein, partial [Anaerolineae bacterium]
RFEGHFHGQGDVIHFSAKPPLDAAGPEKSPFPVPGSGGIPGVLAETLVVRPWNDAAILEETLGQYGDELAAVICEPVMANAAVIPPRPGYLELLRRLTAQKGIVLIFDEVKTGFRLALGGAQEYYGVTPDLSVTAKALAAGFPIAAVGGKRDLMDVITQHRVVQSATYHTNPVSMAACRATILELSRPGFYQRLFELAESLQRGLQAAADELEMAVRVQGVGPVFQVLFSDRAVHNYREVATYTRPAEYARFWRAMMDRGVYFNPVQQECWFVSGVHTAEDVRATLERAAGAMASMHG